jgi:nucleotide-binding universal stress UspA family protein
MFRRILVPLDLSERRSHGVEAAARLADPSALVTLVHVIAEIEGVAPEELEDFYAGLRARAEDVLQRRADELAKSGLDSRIEIVIGRRGAEILRVAEEGGHDLIVLASHRVDPARPGGGLGTLSHQVALLAPCDVLLVREPPGAGD